MPLSAPEPLNAAHDVSQFACGKPALDHWLQTRALSNQEKGFTVVMVVHDAGRVVGYYVLAPTAVMPTVLPRSIKTGQPPNPVPCLLLGQLATNAEWAGHGIGTGLLRHALIRCVQGARLVGGRALMVNAIDPEAAAFWQRRGFLPSKDDPLMLFRSIADIAVSVTAAGMGMRSAGGKDDENLATGVAAMTLRFDMDFVRRRAGDKVFARGEAYFADGQVEILDIKPKRVLARVSGSELYRTVLTGKGKNVGGECSCPAFEDFGFCKHMVAVALAANQAEPPEGGGTLDRIRAYLLTKDAATLTALLLEQAEWDDGLFHHLEMLASAACDGDDDKTVLSRLRKAITSATRIDGFVHHHEAEAWADGVAEALEAVAALVPTGRAAIARPLAEQALACIEEAIEDIDDSDGLCSELLYRARDIHLAACKAAPPEPVALARDLFARETEGSWDTFFGAADLYAEVLGEKGMAEYRRLATEAWAKIPPLHGRPRTSDDFSTERSRLAAILDDFAAYDGDVEARIALRTHDLSSPGNYLDLARLCLEHGREAEALRYAEEGLWLFEDDPPYERLVVFVAERHLAAGNNDAALAVLWRAFDRQPSIALYRRLRDLGGEAARDRAIAALRAGLVKAPAKFDWSSPVDLLIRVLMAESLFAEAWEVVRTHGGGDYLVLELAEASGARHPHEALTFYAARVENLVSEGGNPNYQEACRLIARMAELRDAAEQTAYVATLRARFKAKRNFMKMLGV